MDKILSALCRTAEKYSSIDKIILFGSRARKDNEPRSDIDLAVYAKGDIYDFIEDIEENIPTLLEFDITHMNREFDADFVGQIEKEGVVIYEKP